jgi:hypothetical protein
MTWLDLESDLAEEFSQVGIGFGFRRDTGVYVRRRKEYSPEKNARYERELLARDALLRVQYEIAPLRQLEQVSCIRCRREFKAGHQLWDHTRPGPRGCRARSRSAPARTAL